MQRPDLHRIHSRHGGMVVELMGDLDRVRQEHKGLAKPNQEELVLRTVTRWVNVKLALIGHDPVDDVIQATHI